jgi:uncharacterized protein
MRMSQSTEQVSEPAGTAGPALAAAARPGLADPGAWAVTAFATTSFMLGMYNANLINAASAAIVIPVALFFGGLFAVLTFYFVIASLRTDMVLVAILALIFVGLVLLAIGAGTSTTGFTRAGGWVTLAFAVLAWYHTAGDVISATFGRPVLPVGSLRR